MIQLEVNHNNFTSSTAFTSAFPLVINNLIILALPVRLAQCNGVPGYYINKLNIKIK